MRCGLCCICMNEQETCGMQEKDLDIVWIIDVDTLFKVEHVTECGKFTSFTNYKVVHSYD